MAKGKYFALSGLFCLLTLFVTFLMYWVAYESTTESLRKTVPVLLAVVTLGFCCAGVSNSD